MKIFKSINNWVDRNEKFVTISLISFVGIVIIGGIYIIIDPYSYQKAVKEFCNSVEKLSQYLGTLPINENHEKPFKKNTYVLTLAAMNSVSIQTETSKKTGFKTIVDEPIDLGSNGVWNGLIQLRISHDKDSTYCIELINKKHRKYIIPLGDENGWENEIWTVKTSTFMSEYTKIMIQQGDSLLQNKIKFIEKLEYAGIPIPSFMEPRDLKGKITLAESNFRLGNGDENTLFKQMVCTKKYCPTPINMLQPRFYTIELFDENLEPGKEYLRIQLDLDNIKNIETKETLIVSKNSKKIKEVTI